MAKAFSVFVDIGGRINASLPGAIKKAEGTVAALGRSLDRQAAKSKLAMAEIGSSLKGVAGLAASGGIAFGLKKAFGDGAGLAHEIQALRNAGRSTHEVAEGIEAATAAIAKLPTATLMTGIKLLNETTGAFGDYHHAVENLEFNSKLADVLKNTVHVEDPAHAIGSLIKTLEIRGSAANPETYRRESEKLTQAMTFYGGRLKPEDFYTFASNAQVGIRQLNERFLTRIAPSLIQELGGDKTGTGLTAFRTIIGGRKLSDNAQAAEWVKLGLVDKKQLIRNKQGDVKGWKDGAVLGTREAYQDPLAYMEKFILPRLQKNGTDIADPIKLGQALNSLFKNTKANAFVTAISSVIDRARLKKDEDLINKVLSVNDNYDQSLLNDPKFAQTAIKSSLQNIGSALTLPLMKPAAQMLISIARGINQVSAALMHHPGAAKVAAGLVASLGAMAGIRLASFVLGLSGITRMLAVMAAGPVVALAGGLLRIAAGLRAVALAATFMNVRGLGAALFGLLVPTRLLAGAFRLLRLAMLGTGIGAMLAAFGTLAVFLKNNWQGMKKGALAFKEAFLAALGPQTAAEVKPLIDSVSRLFGAFDNVTKKRPDSQWKKWGKEGGEWTAGWVLRLGDLAQAIGHIKDLRFSFSDIFKAEEGATGSDLIGVWSTKLLDEIKALGPKLMEAGKAAMQGLWDGLKSIGNAIVEWAAGMAERIAAPFKALNGAIGGLFGKTMPAPGAATAIPGKAVGGPVTGGRPYLVGERGPELFVPGATGRIETNGALRRLTAIGRSPLPASLSGAMGFDNPRAIRVPSADQVAAASGGRGGVNIQRGDTTVNLTIQGGGGDAREIGREAERAVYRVLAKMEREQAGLLGD